MREREKERERERESGERESLWQASCVADTNSCPVYRVPLPLRTQAEAPASSGLGICELWQLRSGVCKLKIQNCNAPWLRYGTVGVQGLAKLIGSKRKVVN